MKTLLLAIGAAVLSLPLHASLLHDPGFELADPLTQNSNSNWALNVNVLPGMFGGPAATFSTGASFAQSGDIGIWFRSYLGNNMVGAEAELIQTIAAGPGAYSLSFWVKKDAFFTADEARVEIFSDAGDFAQFDLLADMPAGPLYTQLFIPNFMASAGTTTVTVRAMMVNGVFGPDNPQSVLLDNFDLTGPSSVPAPPSLVLVATGLALLTARRRRPRAP